MTATKLVGTRIVTTKMVVTTLVTTKMVVSKTVMTKMVVKKVVMTKMVVTKKGRGQNERDLEGGGHRVGWKKARPEALEFFEKKLMGTPPSGLPGKHTQKKLMDTPLAAPGKIRAQAPPVIFKVRPALPTW